MTENQNGTYLVHHGILGQKHGVRNGPPYPLAAGDHSASERKAGWRASVKGTKSEQRSHKLTDEQKAKVKKYLKVGAAATGVVLATYGAYKVSKFVGPARTKAGMTALNAMYKTQKIAKESTKTFGKELVTNIPRGAGMAGSKLGKAAGFTVTALAAKEIMDQVVGEDLYKIISSTYNANNKKDKMNFERRTSRDREDKEEEDD